MVKDKNFHKIVISRIPIVSWLIFRGCNYNCSYCTSRGGTTAISKNIAQQRRAVDFPPPIFFLDKFSRYLSGSWIFNLCGSGEPFLAPKFLEIVEKLVKTGYYINLMTNFSAPFKKIIKFCEITGENLLNFSASLHLEHAELKEFLKKALVVKRIIGNKFSVCSIARKGRVIDLKEIGQIFRDKGIPFIIQPERDDIKMHYSGDPFVEYSDRELEIIKDSQRGTWDKNSLKLKGKLCWAGSKYFVINYEGDAWRCFPAYNDKRKEGYLGNILEGTFKLNNNPSACLYQCCYCITPNWLRAQQKRNLISALEDLKEIINKKIVKC